MPHYMLYVQLFFFLLLNLIYLLDNYSSACPQESKHFTYDTAYLTLDYMLYVQLFLFFLLLNLICWVTTVLLVHKSPNNLHMLQNI